MEKINFWQGKNIRLRGIEPEDAALFFNWNRDSNRNRNLDFLWPPQSFAAVKDWTEKQSLKKLDHDGYVWVIETIDSTPVGVISSHNCNPRDGTFSYGLDIVQDQRRKGYASEAIRIVLRYYFTELRYQKANICVHADNPASIKLHGHLGFTQEGRQRRMVFTKGEYVDLIWFGITDEEYFILNGKDL